MNGRGGARGSRAVWLLVPLALLVVILPACSSNDNGSSSASPNPADLEGKSWVLTQMLGENGQDQIVSVGVNASFDGSQVSGNSGCNTYHGGYQVSGDTISFDAIASTQMACEPDAMAVEAQYQKLLGEAKTWKVSGRSMSMFDANGTGILQFSQG